MGLGVGWTQGSMHGVGVGRDQGLGHFFMNDTLFSFQFRTEDLTHNVRGLCPRFGIHVSSVYCSKIDLSF